VCCEDQLAFFDLMALVQIRLKYAGVANNTCIVEFSRISLKQNHSAGNLMLFIFSWLLVAHWISFSFYIG
jgi:hypothetical protein